MAAILVDYENVGNTNGLMGVDVLKDTDLLIIFYSECCSKIRQDYLKYIKKSGCRFRTVQLKGKGKNALDFYIAAECGVISEKGERQVAIISNDKGFQAVIDYFKATGKPAQIVKAANVEMALSMLNSPEDSERRRKLQERMQKLDLTSEYVRREKYDMYQVAIIEKLQGSQYEDKIPQIIDFIEAKKCKSRKMLYAGAVNLFGREDGVAIFQMIRNIQNK